MTRGEDELLRPEGSLLRAARARRRTPLSIRAAAELAGLSEGRWRQVENGYSTPSPGQRVPVVAPARTLARMATAVGVTPEELRACGRDDAADVQVTIASFTSDALPADVEAYRIQLGDAVDRLPPEKRDEGVRIALSVLREMRGAE